MNILQKSKFFPSLFLLCLLLFFPVRIFAETNTFNSQNVVLLNKGQIVNNDYFAVGSRVVIDGTVNGDAYIAGGQVDINGIINGDLLVAGGKVTVRGVVVRNIRVVGGNVLIEGNAGRNVSLAGVNLTIDKGAKIAGNAVIAGGDSEVLTQVKNLVLAVGTAKVSSNVLGNVTAGVGTLEIASDSTIHGNLNYWSNNKAIIAPGTNIYGTMIFHQTHYSQPSENTNGLLNGANFFFSIIGFISSLILGILFISLMPVFSYKTADSITHRFWLSLFIGFITFFITPVSIVLLFITIIGIPFAIILLFLFGLMLYIAKLFVAYAFGKYLSSKANWHANPLWVFTIGLALYSLAGIIPIIGGLIKTIVMFVGIGAVAIQLKYYFITLRAKKLM
jgi:cytoskeletal protein CcmA (bactofilin family)